MFELTDEERELAAMVRDFAETVVAPQSYEADRTHTLSMDVVAQMGDLGPVSYTHLTLPTIYSV